MRKLYLLATLVMAALLCNPAVTVSFRERLMASQQLVNLTSALTGGFNLQATNNPGIAAAAVSEIRAGPCSTAAKTSI